MTSLDSLVGDLAAEDLSVRLYAVLSLHDRKREAGLAQKLGPAIEKEQDPAFRRYLTWLAAPDADGPGTECLKGFLLPLLSSPSPTVRSRAIRLLHRWYPDEAPRHLAEMLVSDLDDDRRAALANAFFLPFDSIRLDILRFIIREESPALLLQAGNLLIVNPDPEVARVVASIAVNATPDKAPVIRQILARQVEFLGKAGLVAGSTTEEVERFLQEALQHRKSRHTPPQDPDQQAAEIRKMAADDPARATEWLKRSFRTDAPAPLLVAMAEQLALLEPEFLRPHLPELLRSSNLPVQVAGLTALTRLSPVQAEKLLEQYVFSSMPQRRKTGFHVLSLMERAFALPLMIRTFAREQDAGLLDWFTEHLPEPLDASILTGLLKESMLSAESHSTRVPFLGKLCEKYKISLTELTTKCGRDSDFTLENVMVNRAAIEAMTPTPVAQPVPAVAPDATPVPDTGQEEVLARFRAGSVFERMTALQGITGEGDVPTPCLEALFRSEKNEFLHFQLEAFLRHRSLAGDKTFSPVDLLRKSLAKLHPAWVDVAAGLSALNDRAARLAAPLVQGRKWSSWPAEILPVVLAFAGKSGQAVFSTQAAELPGHPKAEVRYAAIRCLERINPEELGARLPGLVNDRSTEIVALLGRLEGEINAKLSVAVSLPRAVGAGIRSLPFPAGGPTLVKWAAAAGACLLAAILVFTRPPEELPPMPLPSADARAVPGNPLFAAVKKPPQAGEERVVFGKIVEVFSDGLVIHSPALQRKVLVRCRKRPEKRVGDHFNARVTIVNDTREVIESVELIDSVLTAPGNGESRGIKSLRSP